MKISLSGAISNLRKRLSKTKGNDIETNVLKGTKGMTETLQDATAAAQNGENATIVDVDGADEAAVDVAANPTPENVGKFNKILSRINIKELPKKIQDEFKEKKKKLKELQLKLTIEEKKAKVKTKVTHAGSNNKARVQLLQDAIVLFVETLAQDNGMNLLDHLFSAQNQGISVKPTQNTKERVVSFTPSGFYTSYLYSKKLTETAQKLAGLKKSSVGKWYNNMVEHVTSPQMFRFATLDQNSKIGPIGADNYQQTAPIEYLNNLIKTVYEATDPGTVKPNTTIHNILNSEKLKNAHSLLKNANTFNNKDIIEKKFKNFINNYYRTNSH